MFLKQVVDNSPLSAEEVNRYSRHIFLPEIGGSGQQKIKKAKVLVVGAGGLGSPVLNYLCAAGIGTIGIIDFDIVDISNLQRQIIHNTNNIGTSKTASAAKNLAQLNPYPTIKEHNLKLANENAKDIFNLYDIIVDCCDNFTTRYLIADTASSLQKPYILGAISRYNGQITTLKPYEHNNPSYRDIFPHIPQNNKSGNCSTYGVLASLPGVIGSLQATEVLKLVTGIGQPLIKRLLVYEGLQANFYIINY